MTLTILETATLSVWSLIGGCLVGIGLKEGIFTYENCKQLIWAIGKEFEPYQGQLDRSNQESADSQQREQIHQSDRDLNRSYEQMCYNRQRWEQNVYRY